jgi:hypothetical protein
LQRLAHFEYAGAHIRGQFAALPFQKKETTGRAQTEKCHSSEPGFNEPGKRIPGRQVATDSRSERIDLTRGTISSQVDGQRRSPDGSTGTTVIGLDLAENDQSGDWRGEHQHQRTQGDRVARGGAVAESHGGRSHCRHSGALPQKMKQSPSYGMHETRG